MRSFVDAPGRSWLGREAPAMQLTTLDWIIIVVSVGIMFVPAIVFARWAGENTAEFFAAGRRAPWWLIGISLVATRPHAA